jgi:hypothetical protein
MNYFFENFRQRCLSKIIFLIASIFLVFPSSAKAIEFEDGRTAFEKSPRLLDAMTTFSSVRAWGAKYYFTVELPQDIGEPLGQISIQQRQGSDEIDFYADETFAFIGDPDDKNENIPLKAANWDEETKTITLVFGSPVPPGRTLTIGLKPKRNPDYGGVYLFGVTAFPRGEKPEGLYLGVGRLNFYDNDTFNGFFH